ncbi:2-oxoacid:ferredoxin oxidoreductase subunit beta, partial [Vibrio parahaemolyticus]|nr:2-oxoacid:ferredoxin oxidoreductase subunit beta [Vibrio parahaemolyticus]
LGATFVAQSFSGDKQQLVPLIKAAMLHNGFALLNVISPCVTFNNNPGSTKSYDYVREHMETTALLDFVPLMREITTTYESGNIEDL